MADQENQEQQQENLEQATENNTPAPETTNELNPAAGLDGGDTVAAVTPETPAEETTEEPDGKDFTVAEIRELFDLPAEWSDENVVEFFTQVSADATATAESVKLNGVFLIDPTRASRDVSTWGEAELRLAIEGKLEGISNKQLDPIIVAYKKLVEVEPAWSNAQIIDNFRNGTIPQKTTNGVWVTDVTRASKPAESWTTLELEAWAVGEITCTPKADDRKLALALVKALSLKPADNSVKAVKEAYLKTKGNIEIGGDDALKPVTVQSAGTEEDPLYVQKARAVAAQVETVEGLTAMNVSYIDGVTSRYLEAVALNRAISVDSATQAQKELAQLFDYAVALEPQAMVAALERIKGIIGKNLTGVFSGDNAYRYTHLVPEARGARERHIGLLTLLAAYANPAKEVRKQLDLKYLLRTQSNEKQAQLTEYFQKIA